MDILHLLDRMEELFNESRSIWFTHNVIVDEDRMLDLIDQMRGAVPQEIKEAQQIRANRDRILTQAREEADRTLALAREKSSQLTDQDSIVQSAHARAEQVAAQTEAEADEYVIERLTHLQNELDKIMNQVKNGITALQEKSRQEQPE